MSIDKYRVGREFHQQASEYDRHATVQKRVVDRLISLVQSHLSASPSRALDIGCGTGQLLASLVDHYPDAHLCGLDLAYNMTCYASAHLGPGVQLVNGDAEHLPFKAAVFDLVVSTSTLQWIENLDEFFRQCHRVLRPDGLLCIAFFGGQTMRELQECYRDAAGLQGEGAGEYLGRLHRFKDVTYVRKNLEQSNFSRVLLTSEIEIDYYPGVSELLRSIKSIGAGSSAQQGGRKGLGWRRILNETSRLYDERYGSAGQIPVTYEVLYLIASKDQAGVLQ